MSGLHFVPFLPTYIPPQLCQTVGIAVELGRPMPDACMDIVRDQVAESGVSAAGLSPEVVTELEQVVAGADSQGVDLKIVVINADPPIHTPLRDIATEVGEANPGATVLALSPSYAGTYSPEFDRSTLEAGEDLAKTGNPVLSSQNFVGELTNSHFPWTPFSIALLFLVVLTIAGTRVLQKKGKLATVKETASISTD